MRAPSRAPRDGRPGLGAFTLVELLVVIAVIGALIGLLLPSLGAARSSAKLAACASNMRQLGLGLTMYADHHEGLYPPTTHDGGLELEKTWVYTLMPYLDQIDEVRICPADPLGAERMANHGTSYVLNEYVCVPGFDQSLKLPDMALPGKTMVLFTVSDSVGVSGFNDHTHSRNWFKTARNVWSRILSDIQPDRHGSDGSAEHTSGSANYLYADNHVEAIAASQIKSWADAGENFARPPR
ncbi:MAG: type II secretion system protein [Phycisphaeraceae bacterium]|nr:type II secretion system protein [Phycisphaeraceae bacterium]